MQLPLGWLLCEAVLTMWLTFPLRNGELLIRVLLRLRKKLMFDASKVGLSVMKVGTRQSHWISTYDGGRNLAWIETERSYRNTSSSLPVTSTATSRARGTVRV
ncbi:hypothetical protein BTO12_19250 [Vibrio splendidus]|nr:hypothetical protein BTO12_19250 [Vibrio splendidus]